MRGLPIPTKKYKPRSRGRRSGSEGRTAPLVATVRKGDAYQDQGLIFPGEPGQPMHPYTLTGKLERILKRTGLPKIRFHDLRHTCATLLLNRGVHPKSAALLLPKGLGGGAEPLLYVYVLPANHQLFPVGAVGLEPTLYGF